MASSFRRLVRYLRREAEAKPRLESAEVNALPERVRRYIMWLETEADPAGTLRENFCLRENVAGLQEKVTCYRNELRRLRDAFVTAPIEDRRDPDYADEVRALGERIGFGVMMGQAQREWAILLRHGDRWKSGGELCAGPPVSIAKRALARAEDVLREVG